MRATPYGKLYVWIDTATPTETALTVSIEGTVRPFLDVFMWDGGSNLIPLRDILIPHLVFHGPNS
jgi:hypothetical protein